MDDVTRAFITHDPEPLVNRAVCLTLPNGSLSLGILSRDESNDLYYLTDFDDPHTVSPIEECFQPQHITAITANMCGVLAIINIHINQTMWEVE